MHNETYQEVSCESKVSEFIQSHLPLSVETLSGVLERVRAACVDGILDPLFRVTVEGGEIGSIEHHHFIEDFSYSFLLWLMEQHGVCSCGSTDLSLHGTDEWIEYVTCEACGNQLHRGRLAWTSLAEQQRVERALAKSGFSPELILTPPVKTQNDLCFLFMRLFEVALEHQVYDERFQASYLAPLYSREHIRFVERNIKRSLFGLLGDGLATCPCGGFDFRVQPLLITCHRCGLKLAYENYYRMEWRAPHDLLDHENGRGRVLSDH
ncbi:MAG: hypothetical protein GF411_18565 [Candidatus Lokiarchaeota archaeon]|nr:hypothetical protein [Candidatus Lokiarchaeota archaeon]